LPAEESTNENFIDLPLDTVRRVASQHGDRVVTIDYYDVNPLYAYCIVTATHLGPNCQ